jgi:chemotaxis protein MotB
MARKLFIIAAFGLLTVGCVSQEKYNALRLERDRFAEQLGQAQAEARGARSEADAYKNQLSNIGSAGTNKDGMIVNLTNQNSDLQRQLDELNRRYSDAVKNVGAGSPLPVALTNELQTFANQNSDIVDFDSARGIVKFKSDVTFSPGSADVTSQAKSALSRFSQILNSPTAAAYELMVAGHTDDTNVVNPNTINAGHKDNWYLSAHRAISVAKELMGQRVNTQRMAVTGYADQRPIASNSSEAGKAQNRRVEVLILPTQVRTVASAPQPAQTTQLRAAPAKPLNKDNPAPPRGPALTETGYNK